MVVSLKGKCSGKKCISACDVTVQVFKIAYCEYFDGSKKNEWLDICKDFVHAVRAHQPSMLLKQKVHLLLHLVECMEQFGPTSGFNSER